MNAEFPLQKELGSPQLNTAQKVFMLILVTGFFFFHRNAESRHQHMKNKEISISPIEFKMFLHLS